MFCSDSREAQISLGRKIKYFYIEALKKLLEESSLIWQNWLFSKFGRGNCLGYLQTWWRLLWHVFNPCMTRLCLATVWFFCWSAVNTECPLLHIVWSVMWINSEFITSSEPVHISSVAHWFNAVLHWYKFLTIFRLERCTEMHFIFWNVFLCAILLFYVYYVFLIVQYCYFIPRCVRIGSPGDLFLCWFLRESPTQWRTLLWPKICCYAPRWAEAKRQRPDQPLCYCPNISANQLIRTPHSPT